MIIITNSISLIAYLPNPKTNPDLDPNPTLNQGGGTIFLGGKLYRYPSLVRFSFDILIFLIFLYFESLPFNTVNQLLNN